MTRLRIASIVFAMGAIAVACGSAPTPAPPTATPAPTPTPNPHLTAPASVDTVYQALRKAGLAIAANTADSGLEPIKTLNLTYEAWPLILEQYSSIAELKKQTGFDPKIKPKFGDAAFSFVGLNIYVAYGPQVQNSDPIVPDRRFALAAARLAAVLDPLLGPLEQSAVEPIDLPTAVASPSPAPTAAPKPTKTPKPSKKPKPTKTPKP
ncbi:MAG: hypothetical protein ACXWWR_05965 [Candidatus Limnocylindrales bacterium]